MSLGVLVDIAASILAVLALFTLAATAINEAIGDNLLRLRARTLEQAVRALLESRHVEALAERYRRENSARVAPGAEVTKLERKEVVTWAVRSFYQDPDIRALMNGARKPSAIEPRRYALTVLNLLGRREELEAAAVAAVDERRKKTLEAIRETAEALGADRSGAALAAHADRAFAATLEAVGGAADRLETAVALLEKEFGETMDRATGWYLRKTRLMSFFIGLTLAAGANVDFLRYADRLMTEAAVREEAASMATLLADDALLTAYSAALRAGRSRGGVDGGEAGDDASPPPPVPESRAGEIPVMGGEVAPDASLDLEVGQRIDALLSGLEGVDVRVGWDCVKHDDTAALLATLGCGEGSGLRPPTPSQAVGWLLIAFGVTLGAQFWFDLLKRVAALRTSGFIRSSEPGGAGGAAA